MPPTNVGQIRPTGPRDINSSPRQPEPVVAATDEPASGNVPTMRVAAAGPETPLSAADPRPTAPTTPIWPDPPPIPPSVQADDAGAATASPDPAYSVADASDSVSGKDERTSTFDIPIGLFPAFAFGLVVLGFGLRFLMICAAARRAQGNRSRQKPSPHQPRTMRSRPAMDLRTNRQTLAKMISKRLFQR